MVGDDNGYIISFNYLARYARIINLKRGDYS